MAARLFKWAGHYRFAWLFMAISLTLMIGRRVSPLLAVIQTQTYNLVDAALSLPISVFLCLGVFGIRRLMIDIEVRNLVLHDIARTDALTGALSRSEIFAHSLLEVSRSLRTNKPLAFLSIDIDYFKHVNDQFGHLTGDVVLQKLTSLCQSTLRPMDSFGRVGGEEFLTLMPDTDANGAIALAERMRVLVATCPHSCPKSPEFFITISIGVAVFEPGRSGQSNPGMIVSKMYERADQAMYKAKQLGRNRVHVWTTVT